MILFFSFIILLFGFIFSFFLIILFNYNLKIIFVIKLIKYINFFYFYYLYNNYLQIKKFFIIKYLL